MTVLKIGTSCPKNLDGSGDFVAWTVLLSLTSLLTMQGCILFRSGEVQSA